MAREAVHHIVAAILSLFTLAACGAAPPESGSSWGEADALFHRDARWLGADAAYSVHLGGERVLWLFGDTFVATTDAHVRSESEMVRNTVGIQEGLDPRDATFRPYWGIDADGTPASFFAEDGDLWHWPGGAAMLDDGSLVVFLSILRSVPEGLGFASAGWRVAHIDDASAPPDTWAPRFVDPPAQAFDANVSAVVRDGEWVVALATRFEGMHRGYLVRWSQRALMGDDLASGRWWAGSERGWVALAELGGEPAVVIDDAAPESSLHFDESRAEWIHVASYGFGASYVGLRRAPALTGPWSAPERVFTPPESRGPEPFVYAAKAHPELVGDDGGLVVTYATNSFDFWALFRDEGAGLYWPRFVRIAP